MQKTNKNNTTALGNIRKQKLNFASALTYLWIDRAALWLIDLEKTEFLGSIFFPNRFEVSDKTLAV